MVHLPTFASLIGTTIPRWERQEHEVILSWVSDLALTDERHSRSASLRELTV